MSLAHRVSGYNRRRKWRLFQDVIRPTAETTVLDVGFSDREYSPNDNFLEKNYAWPENITALGVDAPVEFPRRYPSIQAVQYDGGDFPFPDKAFDVCWSNAVIEHVGTHADRRGSQVRFVQEATRVAKTSFITTPNKWFPIEVHTRTPFLHWLPKRWFDAYLRMRDNEWATGDYMDLLSFQAFRAVLRQADIGPYRVYKNRLGGISMDFVAVFGDGAR